MVKGLEVFRAHFRNFAHHYVLIGGAACDIVMTNAGLAFRATKDLISFSTLMLWMPSLSRHSGNSCGPAATVRRSQRVQIRWDRITRVLER